jgi:hypothetical protein
VNRVLCNMLRQWPAGELQSAEWSGHSPRFVCGSPSTSGTFGVSCVGHKIISHLVYRLILRFTAVSHFVLRAVASQAARCVACKVVQ